MCWEQSWEGPQNSTRKSKWQGLLSYLKIYELSIAHLAKMPVFRMKRMLLRVWVRGTKNCYAKMYVKDSISLLGRIFFTNFFWGITIVKREDFRQPSNLLHTNLQSRSPWPIFSSFSCLGKNDKEAAFQFLTPEI